MDYFHRPETPGLAYFRCDRMRANLSTSACSTMWQRANNGPDQDRGACHNCPLGAEHAGEASASLSPLKGTLMCSRCNNWHESKNPGEPGRERPAGRLIFGRICVSCYNREREWLAGSNAKGTRPTMAPLCRRRVRYVAGGEACTMVLQHSADMNELVIETLRKSKTRVRFGFSVATQPTIRQLRLF